MKKVIFHIKLAVISTVFMTSCVTKEWNPVEDLDSLARDWSYRYVDDALDYAIEGYSTNEYYAWRVNTPSLKDTLSIDIIRCYKDEGDSVNVTSKLLQIKDSVIVTTEGYIYSDRFWAHLFTAAPGIVNFEGKFHVDFFENGKTTPWAWSEIEYSGSGKKGRYSKPYNKSESRTNWY